MNIKKIKREIEETDHRETKRRLIDEALARVGSEREGLVERLATLEGQRSVSGRDCRSLRGFAGG